MITLETYLMGREKQYRDEYTDQIMEKAHITVARCNELLERAGRSDIDKVVSGWRPQAVNKATRNAAPSSRHITAEACDLPDADRTLAGWVADNLDVLEEVGLWAEDFRWTPTWVHLQTVAPKSGRRVFIPSVQPPLDPSFPVTWA